MQTISPSPVEVRAYIDAGHTNAQAAVHYGVHERTIRKWLAKDQTSGAKVVDLAPKIADLPPAHLPADWIARDGQLWKCPICHELMAPLPETTAAEWNARGCYLHQAQPAPVAAVAPAHRPDPAPVAAAPVAPLPAPAPAPGRIVVRVPMEPARPNLLGWLRSHLLEPGPTVVIVATAILILICS